MLHDVFFPVFFFFSFFSLSYARHQCTPTSVEDILDAARHSDYVYDDKVSVGRYVVGVKNYRVIKVVTKQLTWLGLSHTLRVMVTKRMTQSPVTVITFMGTQGVLQLFNEVYEQFMEKEEVAIKSKKIEVMHYFCKAFRLLDLHTSLLLNPRMRYIVTGHSLGGALASLYGAAMVGRQNRALWRNRRSRLITFGAPRVGDESYAKLHDKWIPPFKKLRIVDDDDVVPQIPPIIFGFHHSSREIWARETNKKEYFPVKCAIPLPIKCFSWRYATEWKVCGLGDDRKCSSGRFGQTVPSVSDHRMNKYIERIELLKTHKLAMEKFMKDQCAAATHPYH